MPRTWRVDFNRTVEREAKTARRAEKLRLPKRRLAAEGTQYVAYSAHHLLQHATEEEMARPGHVHG